MKQTTRTSANQETITKQLPAYLAADKAGKGAVLDALELTTGYRRKALVRRLRQLQLTATGSSSRTPVSSKRGRRATYGAAVTAALKRLWDLSHELSGERLHPQIAEYVAVLRRAGGWPYGTTTTELLVGMKLATVKRRIAGFRQEQTLPAMRGTGTTKPSELKELIPIRRGPWDNPPPGYGEVDTVVHCGSSLHGDLVYTVQYTDVATLWVLLAAQWNKGQTATKASIVAMRKRLPFALLGLDPDSGSEFINWLLHDWCKAESIVLTRIRPGKKNDHGRIEQKNYANVRQFVGYVRLDRKEQARLLQELYDVLEVYLNFFIPSRKCIAKERVGSHYKRIYDTAQTPYARTLARTDLDEAAKDRLQAYYETLDLVAMKQRIDRLTEQLLHSSR